MVLFYFSKLFKLKGVYQYMTKRPIGSIVCWKTKEGYRNFIKIKENTKNGNQNYIPYARYIIQKKIGRKFKDNEIVHHINEDKLDDRIENLKLMLVNEHIKMHKKGFIPKKAIDKAKQIRQEQRKKESPEIVKLWQEGNSLRKISKIVNRNRSFVTKIIKELKGGIL